VFEVGGREREEEGDRQERKGGRGGGESGTSYKSAIIYAPLVSSSCIPNVYE